MSLILDALNRSRQDNEQVPGLASHHPSDGVTDDSGGGIGWVQWLLVAALALAVLAIAWLLLDRTPPVITEPAVAVVEVNAPRVPVVAPAPAPVPVDVPAPAASAVPSISSSERPVRRPPVEPEPAAAAVDANVAALYQQQGEARAQPQAARQPPPETTAAPAPASRGNSVQEETLDIEKLVAQAEAELANDKLQDNGVPFLATLSQQTKDAVPTLMYLRHDYSGTPGKSSVLINGKTLSTGSSVRGVKVVEILPESVVLEFSGTRFRLRALNSWVNL